MIFGKDIDELLYKVSKILLKAKTMSPRGLKTKEIINAHLVLENPRLAVVTNPNRKFSKKYLGAEMLWYMNGDRNIENIKDYASMWSRIADSNGEVNSNYGNIVFKEAPIGLDGFKHYDSQFDYVIETLKSDKDSRQAIINFNQPKHKYKDNMDMVCTISAQYFIRDDKLDSLVTMRSNDFAWGYCNDQPFFSYLQMRLVDELKDDYPELKIGKAYHNVGSLHAYERHFGMLESIIESYESNNIISEELPYNGQKNELEFKQILNNWKKS